MAMVEIIKDADGVGHRHMVVSISALEMFSFGYVYIHEDHALSDGQAKARSRHHHWRFIKEGSSMLRSFVKEIMHSESIHKWEPQQKTRRIT